MSGPFTAGHKVFNTDLNPILLGWVDFSWFGSTLAYVSADAPTFVFSIDADVTAVIEPGMRVKLTQTTDKFFIVTAVGAFSAGHTQITVYGGTDYTLANVSISAGSFSTHKKPFGFNASPAKWTETLRDTSDRNQASAVAGTWYNQGALALSVPIGLWRLYYSVALLIENTSLAPKGKVSLSTTNNSESDSDLTAYAQSIVTSGTDDVIAVTVGREKYALLAAKASYYLVSSPVGATMANFEYLGSSASPTIIRAVCAYL